MKVMEKLEKEKTKLATELKKKRRTAIVEEDRTEKVWHLINCCATNQSSINRSIGNQ